LGEKSNVLKIGNNASDDEAPESEMSDEEAKEEVKQDNVDSDEEAAR